MKICIIGGGMQGLVIAENLKARPEKPSVLIADIQRPSLLPASHHIDFTLLDVLDEGQVLALAEDVDVFVLAVPSSIAHEAIRNLIKTGKPVADVSFTPDPPLDLDAEAKKSGSVCVVDCGIAPGLSHILVGSAYEEFGGLDNVRILVGGMPQTPPVVFKHAIYFNPHDLLAEYVRPARSREAGKDSAPPPLQVRFLQHTDPDLGELEAFLSDGLRSLLKTFPDVPEMSEWTLRWKGHLKCMTELNELGLLENSHAVKALANTLGERYPSEKYPDYLLMLVEATKGAKTKTWRILDRRTDDVSAMSRTTGFTTAAVAMLLARKQFEVPGVHAPEILGRQKNIVEIVLQDLTERGINVSQTN